MEKAPEGIASDPLSEGRARLADGEWVAARALFTDALAREETAEGLEWLSWAAWWLDDAEAVFDARERAYRLYRRRGERASAARMATWLAADQLDFRGAVAVAGGWLRRARRLLDPVEPGPEHGWLAFQEGYLAQLAGDTARAGELGAQAADLGRRLDVPDLEMLGLALQGAVLVARVQVEEGMRCLDEATAAALAGEATIPISGAWACCFLVSCCTAVRDYERAFEWCDRIAEFAERYGSRYMLAFCRAEYGAVHLWRGRWREAEEMPVSAKRLMIEAAALARINELAEADGGAYQRSDMTKHTETEVPVASEADRELKAATRAAWALGDYHRFAKETVWQVGEVLVRACGISTGQRVLDVAAGTGNTAIRAAEAGAEVVASDLTPENFEAGRREAEARGVELEWVEADAEALPFADAEFDVVTSSFGAIFAHHHRAVAGEMLRVCRPGGTIGMCNFTPEGLISDFFGALAPYMPPPPPHALPPALWGSEEHVRELFGDRVDSLEMTRGQYVERAGSPRGYREFVKQTFGPVAGTYASLAGEPERAAALDRDFLDFATRTNSGPPGGPAEYPYEYLLVVAHRRAA